MSEDITKLTRIQVENRLALAIVEEYDAPLAPPVGNRNAGAFLDELGYVKELEKRVEKVKKILEARVDMFSEGNKVNVEGDIFKQTVADNERTALDQGPTKDYLESQGVLSTYMKTTPVPTRTVKRK